MVLSLPMFVMVSFMTAFGLFLDEARGATLICKKGPGMSLSIAHDVDGSGVPGATKLYIHFKGGSNPKRPKPGECVWRDRAFGSDEPAVIFMKSKNVELQFEVASDGHLVEGTARIEGGSEREAHQWQGLVDGVLNYRLFKVSVKNSGQGALEVVAR